MAAVNSSRPGARNDDGVAPAMRFLGNAKKSSPIVLAEFHIEVLPLDLDLLRFDNIVHVRREVWQDASDWGSKNFA